ncbi:MAG: Fic family protein, partial [Armatimonadota bacterium]
MRTYERTHPWLTFSLDLRHTGHRLWMLLGEAQSKCEHIAWVLLPPKIAAHMHQLFLAKGAQATTAIEGNTLSEEEVVRHLEGTLSLPPSKEYLAHEIDNVVEACQGIWARLSEGASGLSPGEIKEYNALVLRGLDLEEGVVPGEVRAYSVGVAGYKGAPAEDCEYLLARLCEWLETSFAGESGMEIIYGILRAVIAHVYIAWIHPFGDGNGRTARLVEYRILVDAGVPSAAAHLLSNHYNQTRPEYYRRLSEASQGRLLAFIEYAVAGFVEGLAEHLATIRVHQREIAWRDYVYERFRGLPGHANSRRRDLLLGISLSPDWVPAGKVRSLTPGIADAYAGKTDKTL